MVFAACLAAAPFPLANFPGKAGKNRSLPVVSTPPRQTSGYRGRRFAETANGLPGFTPAISERTQKGAIAKRCGHR